MSCGSPHETDCVDVLARVYEYIDNELDEASCTEVRTHLDECHPCLEKYGLEQVVKSVVHRACGCDEVPADLRAKVLSRIAAVQAQLLADAPEPAPATQAGVGPGALTVVEQSDAETAGGKS